jgi:hypothetical protein
VYVFQNVIGQTILLCFLITSATDSKAVITEQVNDLRGAGGAQWLRRQVKEKYTRKQKTHITPCKLVAKHGHMCISYNRYDGLSYLRYTTWPGRVQLHMYVTFTLLRRAVKVPCSNPGPVISNFPRSTGFLDFWAPSSAILNTRKHNVS